jgi:hypothetical protein
MPDARAKMSWRMRIVRRKSVAAGLLRRVAMAERKFEGVLGVLEVAGRK